MQFYISGEGRDIGTKGRYSSLSFEVEAESEYAARIMAWRLADWYRAPFVGLSFRCKIDGGAPAPLPKRMELQPPLLTRGRNAPPIRQDKEEKC